MRSVEDQLGLGLGVDEVVMAVDTDPASLTYNTVVGQAVVASDISPILIP